MKRIVTLGAALGASLLGSLSSLRQNVVAIDRERPVSGKRRHVSPSKRQKRGSRYMPHQGAKEHERGARSYMQHYFPIYGPIQTDPLRLRAAPIVQVISKRDFYCQPF